MGKQQYAHPWIAATMLLIASSAIVVGIWVATPTLVDKWAGEDPDYLARRGQYGDQYGALNALFAGLAFSGVIAAIYLQHRELMQSQSVANAGHAAATTLNLIQRWESPDMVISRQRGRVFMEDLMRPDRFNSEPEDFDHAVRVLGFLAGAGRLAKSGAMDKALFQALTVENLASWASLFNRAQAKERLGGFESEIASVTDLANREEETD